MQNELPIHVPGNPYWSILKRFGRDEAWALVVNVAGTGALSWLVASGVVLSTLTLMGLNAEAVWASWGVLALSVVGPVVEKGGFFIGHVRDAWGVYKTTRKQDRQPLKYYIKKILKGGSVSLLEDILVHDPCYIALMWLGQTLYPSTPAWILAFVSFILAVAFVPVLEWAITEIRFRYHLWIAKESGFSRETYYEARFHISRDVPPEMLLSEMARVFNLRERVQPLHYTNHYYDCNLPEFSGRKAEFRLRWRTDNEAPGLIKTAQIVWTRASEYMGGLDQHRYFPIQKLKLYAMMKGNPTENMNCMGNPDALWIAQEISTGKKIREVVFDRQIARSPYLLVSVDITKKDGPYVVEIKTRNDVPLLIQAMRYLMRTYPVVQTTEGKLGLPG